jgi:hypothetical protein
MNVCRSRARFQKLSRRWQLVTIAALWVGMVAMHEMFANEYYKMERSRLRTIASTAAYVGTRLLPSNPYGARRAARAYAEINGISSNDIVLVEVGDDQRSLTIELGYKIPAAFALIEWSADKYLTVTVRADLQPAIPKELNAL